MKQSRKKIGRKNLKIFDIASDGRGGSKLLQKTYAPTSPPKNPTLRPSESPPKSKRQRTEDMNDFGDQEYDFLQEDPDFDPRQTKVSSTFGSVLSLITNLCRPKGTTLKNSFSNIDSILLTGLCPGQHLWVGGNVVFVERKMVHGVAWIAWVPPHSAGNVVLNSMLPTLSIVL